jgi:hypothetical protein
VGEKKDMLEATVVRRSWTVLGEVSVSRVSCRGGWWKMGYVQDGVDLADELHADVEGGFCDGAAEL